MNNNKKVVEVVCLAFPDGETAWIQSGDAIGIIRAIADWNVRNQWAEQSKCTIGSTKLLMDFEKFSEIQGKT